MNYDICSVGSALVDFTFSIDKRYERNLISYGIPKGSMTLIEREDQEALIKELTEMGKTHDKACGGSGTNSTVAASLFGAKCHMTCIVSDDDQIILVSNKGQIIRVSINQIRIAGRSTQGVSIFKIPKENSIVSVSRVVELNENE